jgi:hypothetical protein
MGSIYDNYISTLTPLQLTVTEGMLKNTALRVSPNLTSAVSSFTSLGLISSYLSMQTAALAGTGGCTAGQAATLGNIASPTCAALADGIPQYYINLGTFSNVSYPPGLTGIITKKAYLYIGSPTGTSSGIDLSRFAQIFSACDAYAGLANQIIISSCNSDDYLCDTFSNNDNMVTGDITKVNQATGAFGADLKKLGKLIDLNNLGDLGSPLALMQRIIAITGAIPTVALTFVATGVPQEVVVNLDNPAVSVTDASQKAMYTAMTQITGDALTQILQILEVTTTGINTMADLLNPVKLFPTSFQSLTVTTKNGLRGIYTNSSGSVNTTLIQSLPTYVINSTVANQPSTLPYTGTLPPGAAGP